MVKRVLFLFFILLFYSDSLAQEGVGSLISPGKLTSPHAEYEGIKNCTQCHALGGGIPDSKCLDCHDKLAERIKKKEGIHAKYTDPCIQCHTDHKGEKFKIISLEKDKFNHDDTDYPLVDKHSTIDCNKCHKKGAAYTEASTECISCHKDVHRNELGRDCEGCHNIKGWKDIGKFDHNRDSKYALTGKHIEVKCDKCHVKNRYRVEKYEECLTCHKDIHKGKPKCKECHTTSSWKDEKTDHSKTKYPLTDKHLQVKCDRCHKNGRLTGIPFKTCDNSSCHDDPHKRQFKDQTCESCHNIKGWKPSLFDHAAPDYTGYKLEGKHVKTDCKKCHVKDRYKPLNSKSCDTSDCHKDAHKGQFKNQTCESCHTVKGWEPSLFEHNVPKYKGYKLEGKHFNVDCKKCHVQGRYKPLNYKTCDTSDCHKDAHKGQFKDQKCEACHTAKGWKPSFFEHNAPEYKGYRLDGKHLKTACEKCHVKGKYKPLSDRCFDCHEKDDTHKKELGNNCEKCHNTADWKKYTLDHNKQTKFPLIGKHKTTECEKCHLKKRYKTKAEKCIDCHEDIHKGKFKEECSSCHTQSDWFPRKFNHKKEAGLELKGVHNDISCTSCHKTKGEYKGANRYYNQCHVDPHFNQFGSINCSQCHSEKTWNPTQFDHSKTGYPLIGKHRTAECQDCHRNRIYRNTTSACVGCHLDQYSSAKYHVANGFSQDCTNCHRLTFAAWPFDHHKVAKDCSKCHLIVRPESHGNNPAKYATTCENCHKYPAWTPVTHPAVSSGCSSCHVADKPASHVNDTMRYSTTCENCHKSTTTWTSHVHPSVTSNCSGCHLTNSNPVKPASHMTNNWTICENCHKSTSAWTFSHSSATSGCSSCHLNYSTPAKPASHTTNNWTICENCHRSTSTWTFTHPSTTFPLTHAGTNSSNCNACHPGGAFNNSGGCIECHKARNKKVHKTTLNSECLRCHPTGKD